MVRLVKPRAGQRVYDPACGSGGMLIYSRKYVEEHGGDAENLSLYGQDAGGSAWVMGKMNMLLHGIEKKAFIENGDVLTSPLHLDSKGQRIYFDRILANPPFSMNYEREGMQFPERFGYGFCKETGKRADLMFLQHMLFSLAHGGMMATVMPHGVLFRGGTEEKIRRKLIENDHIEAIISLPPQLFYNTGIPACIIVLRPKGEKPAERENKILFINADREFEPGRAQNYLRPEHIEKIVSTFDRFEPIPGYSAIVSKELIASEENDSSLNIRRYADNSPPPEPHDVRAHLHGGVPRKEVEAVKPLFSAHGFDPAHLFIDRDEKYLDFVSSLKSPEDLRTAVEKDSGVKERESTLNAAFESWWTTAAPRLADLPNTHDPMIIRAEFLRSFHKTLVPMKLLNRFQIAGALVTWWEEQSDEFKTIAARGFNELVDGWVDTIRDVIEDAESKKTDRDAMREHRLVRRLLPDYLVEIEEAAAEVSRLEEEKDGFEQGPEGESSENGEDGEESNYAKDLLKELKELNEMLKKSEGNTPNMQAEIKTIESKPAPWKATLTNLKKARKRLRDLEDALLRRLERARKRYGRNVYTGVGALFRKRGTCCGSAIGSQYPPAACDCRPGKSLEQVP